MPFLLQATCKVDIDQSKQKYELEPREQRQIPDNPDPRKQHRNCLRQLVHDKANVVAIMVEKFRAVRFGVSEQKRVHDEQFDRHRDVLIEKVRKCDPNVVFKSARPNGVPWISLKEIVSDLAFSIR